MKAGNEDSIMGSSNVYRISTMGNSITKPVKSLNLSSNPHYDDPTTTDFNFSNNASLPRNPAAMMPIMPADDNVEDYHFHIVSNY